MGKKCVYMYYFYFHFDQKTVNETTVESVSGNLLNISRRVKEYTDPLDVVYTADIVKNLAQVIGGDKKVRSLWVFYQLSKVTLLMHSALLFSLFT